MLKLIIVLVFLGWILWLFYTTFDEAFNEDRQRASQPATVICAQDVGLCPDGSTVERSGPSCTFSACP